MIKECWSLRADGFPQWLAVGHRLAESNPEPITIADDELAHAVEGIVEILDDFGLAIEALSQRIHIVDMGVEIEFASGSGTRKASGTQHDVAMSQTQQSPIYFSSFALSVDVTD